MTFPLTYILNCRLLWEEVENRKHLLLPKGELVSSQIRAHLFLSCNFTDSRLIVFKWDGANSHFILGSVFTSYFEISTRQQHHIDNYLYQQPEGHQYRGKKEEEKMLCQ